jgi:hypothetical protein
LLINSAENRVLQDLEALANDIPFWSKQTSFRTVSDYHRTVKVGYQHLTKKKGYCFIGCTNRLFLYKKNAEYLVNVSRQLWKYKTIQLPEQIHKKL